MSALPPSGETAPARARPPTLRAALSSSDNALNTVRLVLATLVIFGHVFPLGGFDAVVAGPFIYAGWHGAAVEGFFVISGYLILASAHRLPLRAFLWRRFLRIYPGYAVALLVTAFVTAPLGTILGAHWDPATALRYVARSLTLKAGDLPVGADIPWPSTWNGSLWTLFYEALAYVGVGLLLASPGVRPRLREIVVAIAVAATIGHIAIVQLGAAATLPEPFATLATSGMRLWAFFAWGMLAYVLADRLAPTWPSTIAAGATVLVMLCTPALTWTYPVMLVALPALLLGVGALARTRLGARNDLSYGLYVYAFPIQQLLILAGATSLGWVTAAALCLAFTLPVAWASWTLVERPALQHKDLVPAAHP